MHWYAIHSKPRQEERALDNLQRQGFEAWLPMLTVEKVLRGKLANVTEPMFSRYLFIRLDTEQTNWSPIRSTLGVSRLVSFGNRPAVVADELIQALQTVPQRAPERLFQPGQTIKIVSGPLKGIEGIFQQADGEHRAMVLIDLLNKQHRVTTQMQDLRPASL
ncbi:MAG: transcription/translation regulatory transformer protein RfaH [Limnohabitans sp.]|jgi:transcriptional antiterminator RfaH|nr:transcription/translation regulatory transformer protein RfaH [Burkholderiales bacterium]MCE2676994.1 transcription/translation regulatory transformer protein RfaH [Burkholderiaceae bacterium]